MQVARFHDEPQAGCRYLIVARVRLRQVGRRPDGEGSAPHDEPRAVSWLAGAVWSWEEAKAKRESMRRSLGHLVNREQSKGWRAWIAMVEERAEALALMQRSLGHGQPQVRQWVRVVARVCLRQTDG